MIAALLLSLLLGASSPDAEDPSVVAGRQALDKWIGYPWYDRQTDGIKRLEIDPPEPDNRPKCAPPSQFWLRLLMWGALALLLGGLVYLAWYLGWFQLGRAPAEDRPDDAPLSLAKLEALPEGVDRVRGSFLDEVRRRAAAGDYAGAVLYLFAYQLAALDRRQIIHLQRGKTNRQYLREVGRRFDLRRLVEITMVAFEDVFFGQHAIDRARFESCWAGMDRFEALLAEETA